MMKFAGFVLSPLGVLFLLMLAAAWWSAAGKSRRALVAILGGMIWLYTWSCPMVATRVTRWWEAKAAPVAIEDIPPAPVVVVLGGAMTGATPPRQYPDLGDAADRYWQAAQLYRAGKVKAVLVSGGGRRETTEAEASVSFLIALGVPREAILLETKSLNTIENARECAKELRKLGVDRILLVTSAVHMPRAMQAFHHVRLDPFAAPTDYNGVDICAGGLCWLPSAGAFRLSSATLKEIVGLAWYRLAYRAATPLADEE